MKDIMLGTERNLVWHWKKACQAVKSKHMSDTVRKHVRLWKENMCGNEGIHVRHCKNACHVQQEIMSGTEKKFVIRWRNACQGWLWQLTMHVRHCQNACQKSSNCCENTLSFQPFFDNLLRYLLIVFLRREEGMADTHALQKKENQRRSLLALLLIMLGFYSCAVYIVSKVIFISELVLAKNYL